MSNDNQSFNLDSIKTIPLHPAEVRINLQGESDPHKNKHSTDAITSGRNWGLGYLAQYFDITTQDVCQRILWSAIPLRKSGFNIDDFELNAPLASNMVSQDDDRFNPNHEQKDIPESGDQLVNNKRYYSFIERFIQTRPDLYGPLWIGITFIFSLAIFSNIVNFRKFKAELEEQEKYQPGINNITETNVEKHQATTHLTDWHFSMDELNLATSIVIFEVIVVPSLIWFTFWFRGCTRYYTLIETICAYGYSLSIFIPISGLLIIQQLTFRYIVIVLASFMSAITLVFSFLPIVQSEPGKGASHLILIAIPIIQFCLAYILHIRLM